MAYGYSIQSGMGNLERYFLEDGYYLCSWPSCQTLPSTIWKLKLNLKKFIALSFMVIILLPTTIEQYSRGIRHFIEVNVQSWNTKPILVLDGTKLQKLKSIVKNLFVLIAIKMLNQLCNTFTPIVKVFVLAWYLIWKILNLPWPNW
jgi:hypothetical protein